MLLLRGIISEISQLSIDGPRFFVSVYIILNSSVGVNNTNMYWILP